MMNYIVNSFNKSRCQIRVTEATERFVYANGKNYPYWVVRFDSREEMEKLHAKYKLGEFSALKENLGAPKNILDHI